MLTSEDLLSARSPEIRAMTETLRALVREAVPQTIEEVKPAWRCFTLHLPTGPRTRAYYGFIIPHADRVTYGFAYGLLLRDAAMMAGGLERLVRTRYVYVRAPREIQRARFMRWAREAADIAQMPRALRDALLARAKAPQSTD